VNEQQSPKLRDSFHSLSSAVRRDFVSRKVKNFVTDACLPRVDSNREEEKSLKQATLPLPAQSVKINAPRSYVLRAPCT
jgi:hypothetical protein